MIFNSVVNFMVNSDYFSVNFGKYFLEALSSIQDLRVGVANELDSKNLDMEDYLKIRRKLLEEMRDQKNLQFNSKF